MLINVKKQIINKLSNNHDIKVVEYINESKLLLVYDTTLIDINELQSTYLSLLGKKDYQNKIPNLESTNKDLYEDDINKGFLVIYDYDKKTYHRLNLNNISKRAVQESSIDITISGPKDALIEDLTTNIGLIKKRLKTNSLVNDKYTIGSISQTNVSLLYLKDKANSTLIGNIQEKLNNAKVESLLNIGVMDGIINNNKGIVPLLTYTSRCDFISEALLKGKAIIIIDGIPLALVAPSTLMFFLDFHDSLSENYYVIIFDRILFFIALFFAITLTPLVIAIVNYYPDLLPLDLITTTINSRKGISLSFTVETIISEVMLQFFRIAGTRLPKGLNSSLLVIASFLISRVIIDAGILSQAALFVSATSVIASYVISSNYSFNTSINIFRWFLIILTIIFGLVGGAIGLLIILIYLANKESVLTPYLYPISPYDNNEFKKMFIPANLLRRHKNEKN